MAANRRVLALVLVALVVVQAAGAGVAGAQMGGETSTDAADEIYVDDNGDAVLVYGSDADESDFERFEFATDVGENLAYLLITDSVAEEPDVRGRFSMAATPESLSGEGGLSFPQPDELESFSLEMSGETTTEDSRSDISVAATVVDTSGMSAALNEITTTGEITTGGDRFALTADLDARSNIALGQSQSLEATVSESGDTYEIEVDWDRPVSTREAELWRNRTVAERRLETQFAAFAQAVDGSATVDLRENSVTEAGGETRLSQAYTVRLTGVDSGLERTIREALARNPDITDDQADRLASGVADVEVREAHLSYAIDGRDVTGEVRLEVAGFSDLALAYFDVAQAMDAGGTFGANVEQLRAQFEAQQAADLEQTFGWDGRLAQGEDGRVEFEFDAQSRSSNWAAYVDELQARDVPFAETTFELNGGIENERVELDGSASMTGDELFEVLLSGLPDEGEAPPEAAAFIEGLRDSNPERAAFAASYDGDGLRIESAAEFGNLGALRDAITEQSDLPTVSSVVGRADDTGGEVFVRIDGAVSGDATESEVRSLSVVDDETTVHLPGEWDREFPSMDTERARSFLSEEATGADGPGFGPIAAAVAIVAAALVLRRRD